MVIVKINGKEIPVVSNINVFEKVQDELGTIEKLEEILTPGEDNKMNYKALKKVLSFFINEGIEISNEELGTKIPIMTENQVGRLMGGAEDIRKLMLAIKGEIANTSPDGDGKN